MEAPLRFEDCPFYHFVINKYQPNMNGMFFRDDTFSAFISKGSYEAFANLGESQVYTYTFMGTTYNVRYINVTVDREFYANLYKLNGIMLVGGVNIESF